MTALALATSIEEIEDYARSVTFDDIVEMEQAAGIVCGPFHRKWLVEHNAPEQVRALLKKGQQREFLKAIKTGFTGMEIQDFPTGSLRTAINTTVTETNLWDPNFYGQIPAYSMYVGKAWEIEFGGLMGTTATPAISFRARCGTNNSAPPTGTDLGVGPTVTIGTFTAQPFFGKFDCGVRAMGQAASTTTMTGNGVVWMPGAAAATATPFAVLGGAVPTTIDQTITQGIAVSVIWGTSSASNTITPQWMTFRSK